MSVINNILPLETFRQVLSYHPYHFWGLSNSSVPVTSNCNTAIKEHAYQATNAAGREEIRRAIVTAEARLFEYLGYRVGAVYVEKLVQYPRPYDPRMQFGRPEDARGRWLSVNPGEGYIQSVGIEAFTDLDTAAAVTYSDSYGDGITDTFTLTVDLTGQSPTPTTSEITVYFNSTDRLNGAGRIERYRIKPIDVSISGNTATITGRSWLLVRPVSYEGFGKAVIDPDDTGAGDNLFAQTLDVVRRYTDSTGITTDDSQAVFVWETSPPCWATSCCCDGLNYGTENSRDPAAVAYAIGRAGIRNQRLGEIAPGQVTYDSDNDEFVSRNWADCRQPDRIILRYLAGASEKEVNSQIMLGGRWAEIVARLAMAELSERICACDNANKELWTWQVDLSRTGGNNDASYQAISPEQLNNPFGTRRGHLYAWNQVKNLKTTNAFVI